MRFRLAGATYVCVEEREEGLMLVFYEPEKIRHGKCLIPSALINSSNGGRDDEGEVKYSFDKGALKITKYLRYGTDEYEIPFASLFCRSKITGTKTKKLVIRAQNGFLRFPLQSSSFVWYDWDGSEDGHFLHDGFTNLLVVIDGEVLIAPWSLPFFNHGGNVKNGSSIPKLFRIILSQKEEYPLATGPHRIAVQKFIDVIPKTIANMDGIDFRKLLTVVRNKRKVPMACARLAFQKLDPKGYAKRRGTYLLRFLLL
mgnify:CR=1 FL=1